MPELLKMSDRMQSIIERKFGAQYEQSRLDQWKQQSKLCPPIDPQLISHLKLMFSNRKDITVAHPQLQQMLMVQYGIDMIIEYLEDHWDNQTLKVRREREI